MHIFRLIRGPYTLFDPSEIAKIFYPVADYYDLEVHHKDGLVSIYNEMHLLVITPGELRVEKPITREVFHFFAHQVDFIVVTRKMYEYIVAPGSRNDPNDTPKTLTAYHNKRLRIAYNIHEGKRYKMTLITINDNTMSHRYYPFSMDTTALIIKSPKYRFLTPVGMIEFVPDSWRGLMTMSSSLGFAKIEHVLFIDLEEV